MERFSLVLVVVLIVLFGPLSRAEDPVQFHDPNLKSAVEAALGVVNPVPSDMNNLDRLDVMSRGITDVTGLEHARNMHSLDLRKNKIADISPLAGLTKLTWLGIYGNRIGDLTPLSNLVNLEEVDPGANQVSDITPLANLTKLRYLDLTENQIADVSALSGLMSLKQLYLSGNEVVDIGPLSGLTSLTTLDVSRNKVKDVNDLSGLVNLERLYLHSNQIAGINALTSLIHLSTLWLDGNPLSEAAYCTDLAAIHAHDPNMDLLYSPNREAPTGVSATDGTYLDKVQVTWNAICNGPLYTSHYRVARSESPSGAKSFISSWQSITSFDDTTASSGVTYYYWVEAATSDDGEDATGYGVSDTGYAGGAQPPQQVGTITGTVWNDANADADSAGESGLSGWTVYAEPNDAANGQLDVDEPFAVTDANGLYTLDSLTPGIYLVREVHQAGWEQTYPQKGSHRLQVEAGQTLDDIDFGNRQPAGEPNEPSEPACHLLWSQPPMEVPSLDPDVPPIFCTWNEPSRSLHEPEHRRTWRVVLDDVRCPGPAPITGLRWWGAFDGWDSPELPDRRPLAWQVAFWINEPDDVDDALFPQRMVWVLEIPFERVETHPAGIGEFPNEPVEICFVHSVVLNPEEWFRQGDVPADQGALWVSITALYPEGEAGGHLWGWTTRSSAALEPAWVVTLYDDGPNREAELRLDQLAPVLRDQPCDAVDASDMAFELLTEDAWVQWDRPFVPLREWPWSGDEVSLLVEQTEGTEPLIHQEVADDWPCVRPDPIVAVSWNGSYRGYGYDACGCRQARRPRGPDGFLLSVYEDAPPDAATPYGHPGASIWEYLAPSYDEVIVGYTRNPAGEPNQAVWRYSVRLPEDQWFRTPAADRVYWLSVVAVYTGWPERESHLWGWTSRPHVFGSAAQSMASTPDGLHVDSLSSPDQQPIDMCFTLHTLPEGPPE
jgi:hypothetical protein